MAIKLVHLPHLERRSVVRDLPATPRILKEPVAAPVQRQSPWVTKALSNSLPVKALAIEVAL